MKPTLFLLAVSLFLGACSIPEIPNLSRETLKALPHSHRLLIEEIAIDHRLICEDKLGQRFYLEGGAVFADGFIVNPYTVSQLKVSKTTKATIFFQDFECAGDNLWRATGSIQVFILLNNKIFKAWVSGPPHVIAKEGVPILILPQHEAVCRNYNLTSSNCSSAFSWDDKNSEFVLINGAPVISEYGDEQ